MKIEIPYVSMTLLNIQSSRLGILNLKSVYFSHGVHADQDRAKF